ncbi:Hypothetical protein GSB_150968 [Giardia duodenalis]|uniref:Ankyrin repeat protein n=1 Tax=Giardia intestinalis TaxID=5741 RepID=V6U1U4_GIAIN|nr:Hypothetical protein GSB_150968 [Giardia intestinalis]
MTELIDAAERGDVSAVMQHIDQAGGTDPWWADCIDVRGG